MSKERTRVQRSLAACDRGRGKRYPSSVRQEVVRYAQRRRDEGASWYAIADELRAPRHRERPIYGNVNTGSLAA